MIGSVISGITAPLVDGAVKIIDQLVEDKDLATRIKADLQTKLLTQHSKEVEAAMKVIIAESQGGVLAKNWRPITMLVFLGMIVAWWFGFTPPRASEGLMRELFELIKIGMGGYVIGRSVEKVAPSLLNAFGKGGKS